MPLPAYQLLDPACAIKPAWALFDRGWYLHHHAEARAACAGQPDAAALIYYLRAGARLGHSPSPLFDEKFYLARNPDIAELVRSGAYSSGFDHFCQHGHRGMSPHWLFDDALYANLYEDMSLDNLDQHQCYGRYDHYLRTGQRERRMAQFLFDGAFYKARAVEAGAAEAEVDGTGPYVHFLSRLGGGGVELAPSIYFDPAWYLEQNPGAKNAIARGLFGSALQHYLCSDAPDYLDPVPQFSEQFYRQLYPDIATAVETGFYRSGYQQFVQHGAFELRRPRADIDLMYYRDMNERVRNDLNLGEVRDAFVHLRLVGLKDNLPHCPPAPAPLITEPATKQQFLLRAANNMLLFSRRQLDFTPAAPAALAVIMVLYNKLDLTLLALSSLRDNYAGAIELILVDNDSTDDTRLIEQYVLGARVLRSGGNLGFLRAANIALPHVTAPALLYLNNDIELAHGAIAAALARLNTGADIGAVGAKIIRTNGMLQEAGSIIWNEGTTIGYLRDASPLAPEANFVRDVDYCSAVFLLCRTETVKKLGGFDEEFSPAYYEEVDLCVRMQQAGYRTVYDPAIVVHHLEFGSASHSEASMALMRRGRRIFKTKHKAYLETKLPPSPANILHARALNKKRKRILFLEDTVPVRRLGSGFVRANDIVHAIAAAGYGVDVFPINGAPRDVMNFYGDMPEDVEVLHDRDIMVLRRFLDERQGYYDLLWISRTHNLTRVLPILREAVMVPDQLPIVLDTEAVVSCRKAARAGLRRDGNFDFQAALREEFADAGLCQHVTAVSQKEVDLLAGIGLPASLLGTLREPAPTPAPFAARGGLLFVAGMHEADSPNVDALNWYLEEIMPALQALLGTAPVLNVVGYAAKAIDLSPFQNHPRIKLHGNTGRLEPFYNANRIFIAPTRFAGGTPYKVYETASFGLPCVATDLLASQLGWKNGKEILTAPVDDAKRFAAQIAKLYKAEPVWTNLRANALRRLTAENGAPGFYQAVADILRAKLYDTASQRLALVS